MPLTRLQRNEMRNEKWFDEIYSLDLLTTDQDSNLVSTNGAVFACKLQADTTRLT